MKKILIMLFTLLCSSLCVAQTVEVNTDLQVRKLSDKVWLYTAWSEVGSWGRVGSNGLIVVEGEEALLIDTPMHETQTIELVAWIQSALNARIVSFVPGHWHSDCVGGLDYLHRQGVESYAGRRTNEILRSKGVPEAQHSFADSTTLKLGAIEVACYYLGGGHATDNIVVWLPSEKILFGGCMLKDCATDDLGNTADAAPLNAWLETVCKVEQMFPQAEIIVPGHGDTGGDEILYHTKEVLTKHQ